MSGGRDINQESTALAALGHVHVEPAHVPARVCLSGRHAGLGDGGGLRSLCVHFERRSSQLCSVCSLLVAGFLWPFAILILGLAHSSDLDL